VWASTAEHAAPAVHAIRPGAGSVLGKLGIVAVAVVAATGFLLATLGYTATLGAMLAVACAALVWMLARQVNPAVTLVLVVRPRY
jgi:hypothetical protein